MIADLLPCPFCGGKAETDSMQAFRRMTDGRVSTQCAVYCTKCSASITACHDDHKEYCAADILQILTDAWNIRIPPKSPAKPEP